MSGLRRALVGLAVLAFLCGVGAAALLITSDHVDSRGLATALVLAAGWGFAFTGLYAWDRRPDNNIGPLMTAIGFTWFFQGLFASNDSVVFLIGTLGATVPYAILIHLLVSFPSGRIGSRLGVLAAALAYTATVPLQVVWALFTDPEQAGCEGCPENPILIGGHEGLSGVVSAFQVTGGIVAIALGIGILIGNWRRSSDAERRILTPVVLTGGLAFSILLVQLIVSELGASETITDLTYVASIVIFICLPFSFLLGLLRSRIGRAEEQTTALSAENEQLIAELRASRHRIVEAGYAERRRVERDLHDGAQQRLMALTMNLRLARERLDEDPAATAELLDEAMEELAAATAELREFARGIHPVVLSDRGLGAALGSLADRSPVPVEIVEAPDERLPAPVESTAYFVVAEALTNVARYAGAELAKVRVARRNGVVEIEVSDDGSGGADPEAGTGLRGLADRVAALDGSFGVRSEAGSGTTVEARIPCG
ncbi:MAG TPA: sensor histidine kinase [Solirubrobacterales bacterium]|nr:sensor histidine kinase [Solirubrobacterales bacterium]